MCAMWWEDSWWWWSGDTEMDEQHQARNEATEDSDILPRYVRRQDTKSLPC